jgi:hypothetical protein
MSRTSNGFPRGKLGGRTHVKTEAGDEFDHDPTMENFVPNRDMTGQPLASVGFSASLGKSTEYAREKYEIAAWCTLPCLANEADIVETYQEAYEMVIGELKRRETEVQDLFFPDNVPEGS